MFGSHTDEWNYIDHINNWSNIISTAELRSRDVDFPKLTPQRHVVDEEMEIWVLPLSPDVGFTIPEGTEIGVKYRPEDPSISPPQAEAEWDNHLVKSKLSITRGEVRLIVCSCHNRIASLLVDDLKRNQMYQFTPNSRDEQHGYFYLPEIMDLHLPDGYEVMN